MLAKLVPEEVILSKEDSERAVKLADEIKSIVSPPTTYETTLSIQYKLDKEVDIEKFEKEVIKALKEQTTLI